ncbi:hypothetical protein O6H91_20G023200 [Diphasiastrum complanatum]|uniref:Uncharacterized protein n=1 Tax=Diphasiastrum complanatum TaxID=34168 RepID=A0ACC2ANN3_DIPCM|nr:hypothetical protein O6H91_20G023200 [Diphasiastrum complanatum]
MRSPFIVLLRALQTLLELFICDFPPWNRRSMQSSLDQCNSSTIMFGLNCWR